LAGRLMCVLDLGGPRLGGREIGCAAVAGRRVARRPALSDHRGHRAFSLARCVSSNLSRAYTQSLRQQELVPYVAANATQYVA
jgi:hypothetical protein